MDPLTDMTQAKWTAMTEAQRKALRSTGGLTPQLSGLEGCRVEATDQHGDTRRFWVGRSTGWRPCHLEIKTTRSMGGTPVYGAPFQSVRVIRRRSR